MTKRQVIELLKELEGEEWECCDGPNEIAQAYIVAQRLVALIRPESVDPVAKVVASMASLPEDIPEEVQ